jgi:hypothetical protein
MSRYPLDRSAAFTVLLDLDPEGFGKTSEPETGETITSFLEDFYGSGQTRMYEYGKEWLGERREPAQAREAAPEPVSGDRENPYQPFTPEHRVWEIAQATSDLSDEDLMVHAGWVPHHGTWVRDDLIAQYRAESAGTTQEAVPDDMGAPPAKAELAEIKQAFEAGEPAPDIYEPDDMRIWRESQSKASPGASPRTGSKTTLDLIDAAGGQVGPGLAKDEGEFWRAKAAQRQLERESE